MENCSVQRFSNRTAIVTGASSGIGQATAALLASQGASVLAVGRNEEKLRAAMALWENPAAHTAMVADVSTEDGITGLFAKIKETAGSADIAVLAAGQHTLRPLAMTKTQHLEDAFRGNVLSALLCTREFGKLPPREGRSVVWVASAAALIGNPGEAAYAAAKGALVAACRAVATEAAPRYRVNCVAPGVVLTPMSDSWLRRLTPEQKASVEARHLLGFGKPEDVASAIAFLAGDDAKWITGTCLAVDGGLTCH